MAKSSFVEWETLEHPHHNHGADWYISVAIVAFASAVASVILSNYIFAVLILVGTSALLLHTAHVPKIITVRIFEKGLLVGNMLYTFDSLRSFFINDHEGKLLVRTSKLFLPMLVIAIEEADPIEIKRVLVKNLREEQIEESFWDKLMDYFGF